MHSVTFIKPIGYRNRICKCKSLLTEQIEKAFAQTMTKIIVLLHMAVFMNCKILFPGHVAKIKDIGTRHEIKFAAKRCKSNISVCKSSFRMQNDVDLP